MTALTLIKLEKSPLLPIFLHKEPTFNSLCKSKNAQFPKALPGARTREAFTHTPPQTTAITTAITTLPGPVMSLDVDPSGERLSTGNGDCVRVWSLRPILNPQDEANPAVPRLLATLTAHCSFVSCVRFSPDGLLLASSDDSGMIIVHEIRPGTALASFGTKSAPNLENWRAKHTLRGHSNNITDLAWSPSGKTLASASLDNSVIIWNASSTGSGRQVQVLKGHKGFVKGVAWDPFGIFLASQGDRAILVHRTDNWSEVACIDTPVMVGLRFASWGYHTITDSITFTYIYVVPVVMSQASSWFCYLVVQTVAKP